MSRAAGGRTARAFRLATWGALVLAIAYFSWRGVWRGDTLIGDYAVGFSAARAWLLGHDPYVAAVLDRDFILAGGGAWEPFAEQSRNVYFPPTLLVFLPVAILPWPEARVAVMAGQIAATLFVVLGVIHLLGWRLASTKALALAAFLFAFAPVVTTIAAGQTGLLATAAVVAAVLLERSGRGTASGVMYGVAAAIKMQVGLPFVAYLLWRRRWAPALASCLVLGALTVIAIAGMEIAAVPWLDSWLANLSWVSRSGGINDPSPENWLRVAMIHLQYPLSSLIANGALAQLVALGAVGVAALTFVWLRRGIDPRPDLLALAVVAVLGLLVTYHRYYDAVLLAIPIAWACSVIDTPRRLQGVVVLLLSADFILPFQTGLHAIQDRLPSWLTAGVSWEVVVLAQHAWALVVMAAVLLFAAAKDREGVRRRGAASQSRFVQWAG